MARGKKKESALTPEEKLAQALVPDWEQPYKVPKNWCWTAMGDLIELISGRDSALSACNDQGHGIPYILGASNIENNTFHVERWIANPEVISQKGDILLSVKGTIGKLYIQREDEINISRQIMAIRPRDELCTKLVYLYLQLICEELREAGNGLIPGISRKDILERCFPLAPVGEQQRIVDRIEYLFAKLDEAKEKAQSVLDSFETRKAAILHKAFIGELTAEWRKIHSNAPHRIIEITLNELCSKITDGFHNSPVPIESGYPYVMAGNVHETGIDYNNGLYMDEKNHRELYNKANPEKGDILIVNIGASTGRAAIIDVDFEFSFKNCAILKLKKEQINPRYALYYIWLRKDYLLKEVTRGGAQPFLSLKTLKGISVPVVGFDEQAEIVRILDSLFAKEQQAKEAAEAVLEKIDLLKKSILARAFRGELGTNDPSEESALELLKTIL